MNAEIKIERIGPDKAKTMLGNMFPGQRKLRVSQVQRMAGEMDAGRFKLSQDAIVIVSGQLANGQHRLSAVVKNGKEWPFLVLRTNDPEIYKIIDDGMKRTVADVLCVKNSALMAAAASTVIVFDSGDMSFGGRKSASRGQVLEYINDHMNSLEVSCSNAIHLGHKQRLMPGSLLAAFLEISGRFDREQGLAFLTEVVTGDGKSGICKLLRERLIKDKISKARLNQHYVFALVIKAYRAYYEARDLKTLKISDGEEFPQFPS